MTGTDKAEQTAVNDSGTGAGSGSQLTPQFTERSGRKARKQLHRQRRAAHAAGDLVQEGRIQLLLDQDRHGVPPLYIGELYT